MPDKEFIPCPNPKCSHGRIYGSGMGQFVGTSSKCETCNGEGVIEKK